MTHSDVDKMTKEIEDFRIRPSLVHLSNLCTHIHVSSVLKPRMAIILTTNVVKSDGNNDIHVNKRNDRLKARLLQLTGHSKTGESSKLGEEEKMARKKNMLSSGQVECPIG